MSVVRTLLLLIVLLSLPWVGPAEKYIISLKPHASMQDLNDLHDALVKMVGKNAVEKHTIGNQFKAVFADMSEEQKEKVRLNYIDSIEHIEKDQKAGLF
eukprot:TRINITY_DN4009_c0_g1_i1.p1 TRINITY_DN4009_c0_g1~~TRINITY_DN4009_c0_g1_i1.p1  ORF type:complete len:107 (-),score=22.64 TRINITY_DN4009_c0_g1_i1:34-330(-)